MVLAKYEGLGNDFLVLLDPDGSRAITAELARALCDRHRGWGADGLLRGGYPPANAGAPGAGQAGAGQAGGGESLTFELLNADGSEAEMSGNGLRCLAHAAIDEGLVDLGPSKSLGVVTPAGTREVHVVELGRGSMWASTEMGSPTVRGDAMPCNVGDGQLFVDVGNPHLVVLGPHPAGIDVASLGAAISAELGGATGGLNVEFAALGPGRDEVTVRIWERGVGETLACGTGSVAVAAALHHWGRCGPKVTVNQPGGAAQVELRADGSAALIGPSRRIGRCELPGWGLDGQAFGSWGA